VRLNQNFTENFNQFASTSLVNAIQQGLSKSMEEKQSSFDEEE
jgi:hypothetical protein